MPRPSPRRAIWVPRNALNPHTSSDTVLRVYGNPVGVRGGGRERLRWVAMASEGDWNVQDADGYVYAYGGGSSLAECQARARAAMVAAIHADLAQVCDTGSPTAN